MRSGGIEQCEQRVDVQGFACFGSVSFNDFGADRSTLRHRDRVPINIGTDLVITEDLRDQARIRRCGNLGIVGFDFGSIVGMVDGPEEVIRDDGAQAVINLDVVGAWLQQNRKTRAIADPSRFRILLELCAGAAEQRDSRGRHCDAVFAAGIEGFKADDRIWRSHRHFEDVFVVCSQSTRYVCGCCDLNGCSVSLCIGTIGLDFRDRFPLAGCATTIIRRDISIVALFAARRCAIAAGKCADAWGCPDACISRLYG